MENAELKARGSEVAPHTHDVKLDDNPENLFGDNESLSFYPSESEESEEDANSERLRKGQVVCWIGIQLESLRCIRQHHEQV